MKTVTTILSLVAVFGWAAAGSRAADKAKVVTLEGTILCASCALKETKKCQNAIVVKEAGKEVKYYFDDKGREEDYHEDLCGGGRMEGKVVGTVYEKDGKKWIKPTKVTFAKK